MTFLADLPKLQAAVDAATDATLRRLTDQRLDDRIDDAAGEIALRIVKTKGSLRRYLDKHGMSPFDLYLTADMYYDLGGDAEQLMQDAMAAAASNDEPTRVAGWLDSIADRIADWLAVRDDIQQQARDAVLRGLIEE